MNNSPESDNTCKELSLKEIIAYNSISWETDIEWTFFVQNMKYVLIIHNWTYHYLDEDTIIKEAEEQINNSFSSGIFERIPFIPKLWWLLMKNCIVKMEETSETKELLRQIEASKEINAQTDQTSERTWKLFSHPEKKV